MLEKRKLFTISFIVSTLLILCILFSIESLSSNINTEYSDDEKKLTVLYTNDVHGHLLPFDYEELAPAAYDVGGVARRATFVRDIRKNTKHPVLTMDSGDIFTRGKWSHLQGEPDIAAMNLIGYDVMTIGNNEFKATEGTDSQQKLAELIKKAKFPMLCANVKDKNGKPIAKPYTIFDCNGIRVGVFGVTTQRSKSYPQTKGLIFEDPIESSKKTIAEMSGKYDFLIALTHIGYASDAMLALTIPEIDLIVGGDSHTWIQNPTRFASSKRKYEDWECRGTIVVQDGEYGKCVGRIDLTLKKDKNNRYRIKTYSGKLVIIDNRIKPASDVEDMLKRYNIIQ